MGSFLKRWPRLQGPAQHRYLLGTHAPRRKLFERAQANAISLAQGTIDGAGFGHAHLGIVEDQRGDIAGMSVAVADEPAAFGGLEDRGLEHPEVLLRSAQRKDWLRMNPTTTMAHGKTQQGKVADKRAFICLH